MNTQLIPLFKSVSQKLPYARLAVRDLREFAAQINARPERSAEKGGALFSLHNFNGTRHKTHAEPSTFIGYDIDKGSVEEFALRAQSEGFAFITGETHTDGHYRVIIEVDAPILHSAEGYCAFARQYNLPVDEQCKDWSRMFFLPPLGKDMVYYAGKAVAAGVFSPARGEIEAQKAVVAQASAQYARANSGGFAAEVRSGRDIAGLKSADIAALVREKALELIKRRNLAEGGRNNSLFNLASAVKGLCGEWGLFYSDFYQLLHKKGEWAGLDHSELGTLLSEERLDPYGEENQIAAEIGREINEFLAEKTAANQTYSSSSARADELIAEGAELPAAEIFATISAKDWLLEDFKRLCGVFIYLDPAKGFFCYTEKGVCPINRDTTFGGRVIIPKENSRLLEFKTVRQSFDYYADHAQKVREISFNPTLPAGFTPPKNENFLGVLNTFSGFAVEADDSAPRDLWQHFLKLTRFLCRGREQEVNKMLEFCARKARGERANIAVAIGGGQGIGKDRWATCLASIFRPQNTSTYSNDTPISARFNEELEEKCLINMQEAVFAGSAKSADRLKGVISDNIIRIEKKFKSAYHSRAWFDFVLTTNSPRIIHAEDRNRRYFVLEAPAKPMEGSKEFFATLSKLLYNPAQVAGLFTELLAIEVPEGQMQVEGYGDANEQKVFNQSVASQFIAAAIETPQIFTGNAAEQIDLFEGITSQKLAVWLEQCNKDRGLGGNLMRETPRSLMKNIRTTFGEYLEGNGRDPQAKFKINGQFQRGIKFKSLPEEFKEL